MVNSGKSTYVWGELFSIGLKKSISKELYQQMLVDDWAIDEFIPFGTKTYPNTAYVVARILDRSDGVTSSQISVIFLILEDGKWKLENFPFQSSGVKMLEVPDAFRKGIWK